MDLRYEKNEQMNVLQDCVLAVDNELEVRSYPQAIKYMGSKAKIIDFVVDGINRVYDGGKVCDLFAGAGSLSGALGNAVDFVANDIQEYSGVISRCYLGRVSEAFHSIGVADITKVAEAHYDDIAAGLPEDLTYFDTDDLDEFNQIEECNRNLLSSLDQTSFNLFTRCYSGTWWSAEQCCWIDAFKRAIDETTAANQFTENDKSLALTALMHAMAYCSQGTGHFAQYRDAKTHSSMRDIQIYRRKSIPDLFERKFLSLRKWNYQHVSPSNNFEISASDYVDCLKNFEDGTVYADPPYAFVHYSRFYHALETLVLYDHPALQEMGGATVKGRYREERHQSPFSIRSQVPDAFEKMFKGVMRAKSNLVLSYSNTGLFGLEELVELAERTFGNGYAVNVQFSSHKHMTMGRSKDRDREVQEALILAKATT